MKSIEILVLDNQEHIIGWLNPHLVEITEYNDETGLQNISLTHPLNDDTSNDYDSWLEHGNKIWISETEDLKSCLYVINAEKKIDLDNIKVTAEEVLVEFNNMEPIENSNADPITINSTLLNTWFSDLFSIGTVESGNKSDTTSFTGTINPMALLRQIEKDTGNYFITIYEKDMSSNVIHRYLDFKQSLGVTHTLPIEIGENTDKIELEINEDDTYTAIAPIIKCSDTGVSTDTVTAAEILSNFKSLAVNIGDSIPMIIEKKEDGSEVVTAYWNAPFKKDAGSYKVYSTDYTKSNYTHIRKKEASSLVLNKTGNIETSETNKYVIYNLCALALIDKQDPVLNITADVKDLRRLQGIESSYCVGDTVYIRLPHRSGLVESKVTDTEKNPRLIGESKITIGNDISRAYSSQNSIARSGMDTTTLAQIYEKLSSSNLLSSILGVDGSGSGLDADKLDGLHISDILYSNAGSAVISFYGGFKICFGWLTISAAGNSTGTVTVNLPVTYTSSPLIITSIAGNASTAFIGRGSSTTTTAPISYRNTYASAVTIYGSWMTIGF